MEIRQIFIHEQNDAAEKLASSYWNTRHSNVGKVVRIAARVSLATLRERGSLPLPLSEWLETMKIVRKQFYQDYDDEDEDGFGIGTIGDIQKGLEKIRAKYGDAIAVSPDILRDL